MKITGVEVFPIHPPYQDLNSRNLVRYHGPQLRQRVVVVVHTDTGLEGLGETWGGGIDAAALEIQYVGSSPFDWVNDHNNLPMNMALYDLMGKHVGQPAWKLMGQKVRSWVPVALGQYPRNRSLWQRKFARLQVKVTVG